MNKTINALVDITENDVEDFREVVVNRGMPITWSFPSENSDIQVKITFVPAEEEKDEQ